MLRPAASHRPGGRLHPILGMRVSPATKLVWLYLGTYPGRQFRFNVTEATSDLGMADATIWRALDRLQREGFITWQRSKGGGNGDRCGLITILRPTREGQP